MLPDDPTLIPRLERRRQFLGAYGWSLAAWERRLMHLVAENSCGNDGVPLDWRTLHVDDQGCERVFAFLNDSFEIGIGWPDRWHCIIRREAIHKFIWWYLRQWIFGEWLGLRRWIYYRLLHRSVERFAKMQHASALGSKIHA
jgi:hypothetical protein